MPKVKVKFKFIFNKKKKYLAKERVLFTKSFKLTSILRSGFLSNKSLLTLPSIKSMYTTYISHPKYLNKKNEKQIYINILKKKKNYRARRLNFNLPMRGQRSHTNANTRRRRHVI